MIKSSLKMCIELKLLFVTMYYTLDSTSACTGFFFFINMHVFHFFFKVLNNFMQRQS